MTFSFIDRNIFLSCRERRFEDVSVPDDFYIERLRGLTLRCWSMTAQQQCEYEGSLIDMETGQTSPERLREIKARKVIYTLGDESGRPLLTCEDLHDVQLMPATLIDEIVRVSNKLNAFNTSVAAAKKNLPPTRIENSP